MSIDELIIFLEDLANEHGGHLQVKTYSQTGGDKFIDTVDYSEDDDNIFIY